MPELRIDKVIIALISPWCHTYFKVRLGRGTYRCPGCRTEFTTAQILKAVASTYKPA